MRKGVMISFDSSVPIGEDLKFVELCRKTVDLLAVKQLSVCFRKDCSYPGFCAEFAFVGDVFASVHPQVLGTPPWVYFDWWVRSLTLDQDRSIGPYSFDTPEHGSKLIGAFLAEFIDFRCREFNKKRDELSNRLRSRFGGVSIQIAGG